MHEHVINMDDTLEDRSVHSEAHYFIVFTSFDQTHCPQCTQLYDHFQQAVELLKPDYDEDYVMFGARNETQPALSTLTPVPYLAVNRLGSMVDSIELDLAHTADYTVEWFKDTMAGLLVLKYFAIVDNHLKAEKVDFNDGYNYLVLHLFEDFPLYKFYADKELIENSQIQYMSGEQNGRYVDIDEDYQHENVLYMLYALAFNRDLDVFGHLKVVVILGQEDIITKINNPAIQAEMRDYRRKLFGLLYEEDYGHMNRNQMLLNQHLAEIQDEEEQDKLLEYYLDEPKQIQLAAEQHIRKPPNPEHKNTHNPDPTPLYEYGFNIFLYRPDSDKEKVLYMPKEMAASLYRIKVWTLSEIGPHYYEDDVSHNSAFFIQGTMFYKYLFVFYPDSPEGLRVRDTLKTFSLHYDTAFKAKWNSELHSDKYYDFLKAFDQDLLIVGHNLNHHHFTMAMTEMLGHDLDDYHKPLVMIVVKKLGNYVKHKLAFDSAADLTVEKLSDWVAKFHANELPVHLKSQDCASFTVTKFDIFHRLCNDTMLQQIESSKKYWLIYGDIELCGFDCMKVLYILKYFREMNKRRQQLPKYSDGEWAYGYIDVFKNDVHHTQDTFHMPWFLFYNRDTQTYQKIWINSRHDIVVFINILYGYLDDFSVDVYQADKDFFSGMHKFINKLVLKHEHYNIWDREFSHYDEQLHLIDTVEKKDVKIDEMHDFLKEVDEIINHNQDAPEDIKDYKGRRWQKNTRLMDMEVDEMPMEAIIKRYLKGKGQLEELEADQDADDELSEDEEYEYYDEASGKWLKESEFKKIGL